MSGLFGIVQKNENTKKLSRDVMLGTDYHSHLGAAFGGMATHDSIIRRKIHDISDNDFKSEFGRHLQELQGNKGIGVISSRDAQPILTDCKFGRFALAMDGNISNLTSLVSELKSQNMSLHEATTVDGHVYDSMAEMYQEQKKTFAKQENENELKANEIGFLHS